MSFYSLKSENSTRQTVLVLAFKGLDGLQLTAENWSKFEPIIEKIEGRLKGPTPLFCDFLTSLISDIKENPCPFSYGFGIYARHQSRAQKC